MLSLFKKINIYNNFILIFLILITSLNSQDIKSKHSIELNSSPSNQWWSVYNSNGIGNEKIKYIYNGNYKSKKLEYNIKIFSFNDKIYIGESFVKKRLKKDTYFKIGRYYRDFSLYLNDSLSSGSMLISNNAEPMPKIGFLRSFNYKKIDFNFGIAHGAFEKSQTYTKAPMLHEKFLYLKYLNNNYEFGLGIVHEAMWGGGTPSSGNYPSSIKDFLKVFISADDKSEIVIENSHNNALGNHLGIWDFYYIKNIKDKKIKLYYQHFFEDTSGLRFANRFDGLWGIEFSNYFKSTNILFEFLNTKNQDRNPPYVNEKYYNHYQYRDGWSYRDFAIGNPFINYIDNNPSKVFHLGISTDEFSEYNYKLLLSRKIDQTDTINYQISLSKTIKDFLLGVVIDKEKKYHIGFKLSYSL